MAESPGEAYNPLFIYGGVGLGKTHLMHSIAHFVLQKNPNAKVLYVTSETFTNELIDSIRTEITLQCQKFREKYRDIDVLLIDDIQFISERNPPRKNFSTLLTLFMERKNRSSYPQINLQKTWRSWKTGFVPGLNGGLIVDISSPDYETRMAILRKERGTGWIFY